MRFNLINKLTKSQINEASKTLIHYWKSREMNYSKKWTKEYITKGHIKEIKKDQFFAIKERNKTIGFFSLILYEGDVIELRDFVIKGVYREKGYAIKTLKDILKYCQKIRVRKIFLLTDEKFVNTLESLGFYKEGELKNHFIKGENLVIMSLEF